MKTYDLEVYTLDEARAVIEALKPGDRNRIQFWYHMEDGKLQAVFIPPQAPRKPRKAKPKS